MLGFVFKNRRKIAVLYVFIYKFSMLAMIIAAFVLGWILQFSHHLGC